MPDHVHFIVWLDDGVEDAPTLGDVMKAYKSLTTMAWLRHVKAAGLECSGHFWQSRYFDRVIRDTQELEQIRQYIQDNPSKLRAFDTGEKENGTSKDGGYDTFREDRFTWEEGDIEWLSHGDEGR